MKTNKEIAIEWGISDHAVNDLCRRGEIPGAIKEGKSWRIPDDAVKPADGRVSSGNYMKRKKAPVRKALPIGISDYVRAGRILLCRQDDADQGFPGSKAAGVPVYASAQIR